MLHIYTSNSPLLDSVNVKQYRHLEHHGLLADSGKVVYDAVMFLCANIDTSSRDNYLTWVSVWKEVNEILSEYNHHLKRPKNYSEMYASILIATKRNIIGEMKIANEMDAIAFADTIEEKWQSIREQYLAWTEKALTTMYKARMTGKQATSMIVLTNELNAAHDITDRHLSEAA